MWMLLCISWDLIVHIMNSRSSFHFFRYPIPIIEIFLFPPAQFFSRHTKCFYFNVANATWLLQYLKCNVRIAIWRLQYCNEPPESNSNQRPRNSCDECQLAIISNSCRVCYVILRVSFRLFQTHGVSYLLVYTTFRSEYYG